MKAELASLVKSGRLKRERTSPEEIRSYLQHAAQSLADANVPGVSASGRFEFAYTAAHALALAALRVQDVRPGAGPGHRAIAFVMLTQTIAIPESAASSLNRYHTKRNKSEYGDWVVVTDSEARDLLILATDLRERFLSWLATHSPELTK